MGEDKELIFYIDAYSPETIPLGVLGEYMSSFADLIGRENALRFAGLLPGSTKIAVRVKHEDVPKVRQRLNEVKLGTSVKKASESFDLLDKKLANDNAVGSIFFLEDTDHESAVLLSFPGRERQEAESFGPFNQDGTLDGILIAVGGRDETINLRLQNGDATYTKCTTSKGLARELAKHLFEPVRIHGVGRWIREASGAWQLVSFKVRSFDVLEQGSLAEGVAALRAVKGSGWANIENATAELADMRHEDEGEFH